MVQDVPGILELHIDSKVSSTERYGSEISTSKTFKDSDTNFPSTSEGTSRDYKRSVKKTSNVKKRRLCESEPCWRYKVPEYSKLKHRGKIYEDNMRKMRENMSMLTPLELFETIMSPEIYDHIVKETVRYAAVTKNKSDFVLGVDDIKSFLGILLLSGYHKLPSERHYWSNDEDLGVSLVKAAMSRNCFQRLKSVIHFCNNDVANENKQDKGFKVRKLISAFQKSFMQFSLFEESLAVDEMMVKYYGHNSLKQFIRGKPIRFGYKLWALCGSSGYCYNFDLYCGSNVDEENKDLLVGSKIVLQMLKNVEDSKSHSVYFDNYFTGYDLLVHLRNLGFQATRTIRENRLKHCPIKSDKDLKKDKRGAYDYRFDTNEEILIIKWFDNKCVTVGSNFDTIEPLAKVQRWIKDCKSKEGVPQPHAIYNYNKNMGGVDHHDWLVGKYSVSIRGKKWYWPLFTRMLDMAVVNAWIIYRMIHGPETLDLLEFRRKICVPYLKLACLEAAVGRPRNLSRVSNSFSDVRYDTKGHVIKKRDSQRRCQNRPCKAKPRTFCGKCNVTLCVECFSSYHQKP